MTYLAIQEKGDDYVLSLKGNQGNIHQDVQQLFDWARKSNFPIPHEAHQIMNKGHGRIKILRYWVA